MARILRYGEKCLRWQELLSRKEVFMLSELRLKAAGVNAVTLDKGGILSNVL